MKRLTAVLAGMCILVPLGTAGQAGNARLASLLLIPMEGSEGGKQECYSGASDAARRHGYQIVQANASVPELSIDFAIVQTWEARVGSDVLNVRVASGLWKGKMVLGTPPDGPRKKSMGEICGAVVDALLP